jgi:hypothetical protein
MILPGLRLAGPSAGVHPALLSRRIRDLTAAAITGTIALALALGIALAVPHPTVAKDAVILLGGLGVFALLVSARYTVTLTVLAVYLGLLDGPVKLLTATQAASPIRNVLTYAIATGMLVRLSVSKRRVTMPPLSIWVVGFVAVVLMQALNPATHGILKVVGGYRQELQWIPFFFFGFLIMRSKQRFRQLFLILGVIALANGAVSAYQAHISPRALGSWGPGYSNHVFGQGGLSGRTYNTEGEARNRPPGLGADSGGGGGFGVLALPGLLALLVVGKLRRRWIALVCCAGAMLGIASAADRQAVITAAVALLAYAGLSVISGLKITRLFAGILVAIAVMIGVGAYLESENGSGVFARQESLSSLGSAEESGGNSKIIHLKALPRDFFGAPFGSGLGTGAAAGGFGGKQARVEIEGRGVSTEGTLNLIVIELGAPGLLLWVGLTITVIGLAVLKLRHVSDTELRTYLVALYAAYLAKVVGGFGGPTISTVGGAFLWFVPGVTAYWLARPRRASSPAAIGHEQPPHTITAPAR